MRDRLGQVIDFVTEHNRVTLAVLLVVTGAVAAGIPQLDTSSQAGGSAEQFEDLDRVQAQQYIQEQYTNSSEQQTNRTIQPVYVRNEGGNVLSRESLLDGLRYQREITSDPDVQAALHEQGVRGIENLVASRLAGDANASLDEQIQALSNATDSQVRSAVGQLLAENPRAQQFLPTDHGTATTSTDRRLIVVLDTGPGTSQQDRDEAGTALYERTNEYSEAGFFVLNSDAYQEANQHFFGEMVELVLPVALLVILSILVFAYRDLIDVVVGMTGVVLSVLWTFGLLGWLGVEAGTISIVPVVLISGLSIDFGFHIFNRYREQRGPGDGIRAPMNRGVRLVTTALILVTVTAAIGFLANLANPLPVIRDLGVSITLGVVSALVIFVTVVPALKISIDGLLERIGLDRRKAALGHGTYLRPVLESSVTLARRAAPAVLVAAVILGGVGGLAWTELNEESYQQPDADVAEWKQQLPGPLGWEPSEVRQQQQHVSEIYQPADENDAIRSQILIRDGVTSDSTLKDIDAGVRQIDREGLLVTQSTVQPVRSPVTAMNAVAEENESFAAVLEAHDTNDDGIPDTDLKTVYDAFYAADSATAEQVLERTNGEYRSILVTLSLNADFSDGSEVVPRLADGAATMEGEGERTATVAGSLAVNDAVLDSIIGGIVLTMLIALLAIAVTLVAVFWSMHGSASLGAVVAVPITLVVGLVVVGMFVLDIPLTLLTALLMSLVIGLGVDYNIHVGDRFADELDAGAEPIEALRAAVTGTGGALLGSTLTSAGAFATIGLVPQPQLQSFAAIVVIALVTSFLVSLIVLPSLLLLWSRYTDGVLSVAPDAEPTPQD
ncbi:MMPL family transporter [Halovenus sp. WSH3]|uniref:MMPL family transporter n=1 Tax=Halovenus carboxidivorans TaxID=2692199 RepID=A0A6B0TIB7_9EURY|nr:MMPL family transporter [Halovenus carboxidivorans]MXR52949.1 MMPL family transporter [Halovenus carboxidivorans]